MLKSFLETTKRFIVTLRFSILSLFVTLFVIAILTIIFINYKEASKTLLYTANALMRHVAYSVDDEITTEINQTLTAMGIASNQIMLGAINTDKVNDLIDLTFSIANQFYVQEAIYWGGANGLFVDAEYEIPGAVKDSVTSKIIDRRINPPGGKYLFRDYQGNILRTTSFTVSDPDYRTQVWYLAAKTAQKQLWTDIYLYKPKSYLGITLVKPIYGKKSDLKGVLGINISLHWLSWFIEEHISRNAQIFIATTDGKLIAYPKIYETLQNSNSLIDINSIKYPWLAKAFALYKQNHQQEFSFIYQDRTYLASFRTMPQFGSLGWITGVVAPIDDFIGPLKRAALFNAIVGMIILLLSILLVWAFITRIVQPIKKLVSQTQKIKQFQLDDETHIFSRIKEVGLLSDAIYSLRTGLKSFQQYVPASLVRQLIQTGENARIGGTKRPLVIFFSDIKDFTAIAETMDSDKLMKLICEYFEAMSQIIVKAKGTIDKYIGDSIMAFWGAPLIVRDPAQRAARAALNCIRRNNELNLLWKNHNLPMFMTRIGIHAGEAIVGNVGSSERLSYTAIGDTINFTSRLEGINKFYGTHILVSDTMYDLIKDQFVLRKVDRIAVKGKTDASDIYELLAENKSELTFDIEVYRSYFDKGQISYQLQHWDEAIQHFEECLNIYPADTVAHIFINRCNQFKYQPPREWDGTWRMFAK